MAGDGMVAVVKGLGEAQLAVTVIDGGNQYTLIPNRSDKKDLPKHQRDYSTNPVFTRCESCVQAVDGRYVSTYQTEHCNRRPTSPPVQLTEFPPQRSTLSPGHGNFEVGGTGSGETYTTITKAPNFRGGMNWSDRGSVFSPRNSYEVNAFANSLRKYPNSPERSTEVVEKLINYTTAKNRRDSPSRPSRHSNSYTLDSKTIPRVCQFRSEVKDRNLEESPTKEKREDSGYDESRFLKEYDIRFLREISKHATTFEKIANLNHVTSVNTKVQAAVEMVSREVETDAKLAPNRRTIAVPISGSSSSAKYEGECASLPRVNFIETALKENTERPKLFKTVSCYVELNKQKSRIISYCRKTKSQKELRMNNYFSKDSLGIVKDIFVSADTKYIHDECINQALAFDRDNGNRHVSISCDKTVNNCINDDNNLVPNRISEEEIYYIIKSWLSNISLKRKDKTGRHLDRNSILKNAAYQIKKIILNKTFSHDELKSEILNIIENMPLKDFCNLKCYKKKLIRILFDNLIYVLDQSYMDINRKYTTSANKLFSSRINTKSLITEKNLKHLVILILQDLLEASNVVICKNLMRVLEYEVVDILINSVDCLGILSSKAIKDDIRRILIESDQLTVEQAAQIADSLIDNLKEILIETNTHCNYTVCHGLVDSMYRDSSSPINQTNLELNLDHYTYLLTEQIENWLNNLNIPIIQDIHQSDFRQLVINELASDIVDRKRYLELNPNKRGADCDELEHLKFQIFKWINKLVGEENTDTLKHAEELMKRIKGLPAAILIKPQVNLGCSWKPYHSRNHRSIDKNEKSNHTISGIKNKEVKKGINYQFKESEYFLPDNKSRGSFTQDIAINTAKIEDLHRKKWNTPEIHLESRQCDNSSNIDVQRTISDDCSPNKISTRQENNSILELSQRSNNAENYNGRLRTSYPKQSQSNVKLLLNALNEEYDNYLREWIQKIPIPTTNPDEEKLAGLARLGIMNGIWKAITKIKLDPIIHNDPYHYQDVLDDEIEALLDNLPQTNELMAKKHSLKVQLLEKTIMMNEQMKNIVIPVCFKQQLMESLNNYLPKISKFDALKEEIEVQKLSLIEDYILFQRYKQEDDIKSNIYKNNFLRKVEELANNVNRYRGEKNDNHENYVSELISAISKVPIPHDENIKDEVDEILLGIEISHWLSDLPLYTNTDSVGQRKIRDKLVYKIFEIGCQKDLLNSSTQIELRREIRKELDKLSLQEVDLNFIIEELGNRLQNLLRDKQRNKTVSFQEPQDYGEFSRHMPGCSSFIDPAKTTNDGSYMIIGGDVVRGTKARDLTYFSDPSMSQEQWLSMELTKVPSNMLNWSQSRLRAYDPQVSGRNPSITNYPGLPNPQNTNAQPSYISHNNIPYEFKSNKLDSQYRSAPLSSSRDMFSIQERQIKTELPYNQPLLTDMAIPSQVIAEESFNNETIPDKPNTQRLLSNGKTIHPRAFTDSSLLPPHYVSTPGLTSPKIGSKVMPQLNQMIESQVPGTSKVYQQDNHEQPSSVANVSHNPEFYRSTDKRGIKEMTKRNKIQRRSDSSTITSSTFATLKDENNAPHKANASTGAAEFTPSSYFTRQPFGYSTPQQPIFQQYPERPRKKYQNHPNIQRSNDARQKLELEDSDYDSNTEQEDIKCICMKLHRRMRRWKHCYPSCNSLLEISAIPDFDKMVFTDTKVAKRDLNRLASPNIRSQIDESILTDTKYNATNIELSKVKFKSTHAEEPTESTTIEEFVNKVLELSHEIPDIFKPLSEKVEFNTLKEQLFKLAQNIKIPGEEGKLKKKIKKYLKELPVCIFDGSEIMRIRRRLSNYIIGKLKEINMQVPPQDTSSYPQDINKIEIPKYCGRCKTQNLKKILANWVKNLDIKEKCYLIGYVRKEELSNYIYNKLKPIVLSRPYSESEYITSLRANICNIGINSPVPFEIQDEDVNNLIVALVDEIQIKIDSLHITKRNTADIT